MIDLQVPRAVGPELTVNYAGQTVVYQVSKASIVSVEEDRLSEFLAAVPGAKPAPQKPAQEEKTSP